VAALAVALALPACQTLSGSGKGGPELAQLREQLGNTRTALDRASEEGDLPRAGALLSALGSRFDELESRSSAINLVDRESMAIQVATGRRAITEADRWVQSGDSEAVRGQVHQLDQVLDELDRILARAVRGSVDAPSSS
jgi:hypothetical protein